MKPGSGCPNLAILPRPTQARNSGRAKASTESGTLWAHNANGRAHVWTLPLL